MTDEQVIFLESLLTRKDLRVYWLDEYNGGVLVPVHSVQHNHRDTRDPAEPPESVIWLGVPSNALAHNSKCVGLLSAEPNEFKIFTEAYVSWPE